MHEAYQIIITGDGSPTLAATGGAANPALLGEAMHNTEGAISETDFCYAAPFRAMTALLGRAPALMVVGLGLGAIEMLCALAPKPATTMLSFEADPLLRAAFARWLAGENGTGVIERGIAAEAAAAIGLRADKLDTEALRAYLAALAESGAWRIEGALNQASLEKAAEVSFEFLAFDAYSEATSPELWREDFLDALLARAGEQALVSTYAAKGVLNRALKRAGFQLLPRVGFGHKRESTLALRGVDADAFGAALAGADAT